jgi:hypothetical protein
MLPASLTRGSTLDECFGWLERASGWLGYRADKTDRFLYAIYVLSRLSYVRLTLGGSVEANK